MRIWILSDLHQGVGGPPWNPARIPEADVAVVAGGHVLAAGTVDAVRGDQSLEDRFVELVGGRQSTEGLAWLRSS